MKSAIEALSRQSIRVIDGPKHIGKKAIAAQNLPANVIINEFSAPVFRTPTMHTVCLTQNVHVSPTFGAEFISHACGLNTNVAMVVQPNKQSVKVIVTKDVAAGEDLCFNYNTTEWTMSCPFKCACQNCQTEGLNRTVQGFAYLSPEEQDELLNGEVSEYVRSMLAKQRKRILKNKQDLSKVVASEGLRVSDI